MFNFNLVSLPVVVRDRRPAQLHYAEGSEPRPWGVLAVASLEGFELNDLDRKSDALPLGLAQR